MTGPLWGMRTTLRKAPWLAALALGLALTAGCGSKQEEPLVASSAQQASYAARYPDVLKTAIEDFNKREEEANAVLEEVPSYPDALQDPNWTHVLEVVDAAKLIVERFHDRSVTLNDFEVVDPPSAEEIESAYEHWSRLARS